MFAHQRLAVAVLVLASLVVSVSAPAVGPVRAADPVTILTAEVENQPGVTYHRAYRAPADTISGSGSSAGIYIGAYDGVTTENVVINIQPPTGGSLGVGVYEGVTGTATATNAGASYSVSSSGCLSPTGRFEILEAPQFDAGTQIIRFAATFRFQCGADSLNGVIAIDSDAPVPALEGDPEVVLGFGEGSVGISTPIQTITLSNIGTAPATVASVTVGGDHPQAFLVAHGCGTILPGASCSIDVRFRATTGGIHSAVLAVVESTSVLPRTFTLSGDGVFEPGTNGTAATAITIGGLPYLHGASVAGLPYAGGYCESVGESLWYRYTSPTTRRIELDTTGSTTATRLSLMTGSAASPTLVACGIGIDGLGHDGLTFTAEAGVAYWIRVTRSYPGMYGIVLKAREGEADTVVQAGSFSRQYSTFYPYVDSYRDTVAIKGVRNEKASVRVVIYNAAGSAVRGWTLSQATGVYTVTWNGRNTGGSLQPAGKYRIVQTVTDIWGNKLANTLYVDLSNKRLYTSTYTVTRDGGAYSASGKAGTGSISRTSSAYAGGVRITSGTGGAASLAYSFTVPSATAYTSVKFQVLAKGQIPPGSIGLQDWTECSALTDTCVYPWRGGPTSYAWATVSGSHSRNVSGTRQVRGYIRVETYGSARETMDIRDVKLTVVYGILK